MTDDYDNLLDLIARAGQGASRDELVAIQCALDDYIQAQRGEAHLKGYNSAWNEAHDSCSESVAFIRENYGDGLSPDAKIVLQWAEDRITMVSYASYDSNIETNPIGAI